MSPALTEPPGSAGARTAAGSPVAAVGAESGHDTASDGTDREPVVIWGRRTAFGRRGGAFSRVTADRLLAPVLAAVVADLGVDAGRIDDVIVGNATGGGGNLARLALLEAGFPVGVPGLTIDRQCGSGLEAIVLACRLVAAGAGSLYLAGGVESCSTAPLRAHRLSSAPGAPDFYERVRFAPDSLGDPDMGVAAENVAERFGIDRARQDAFAARSHRLAVAAARAGDFAAEIVPIGSAGGAGAVVDPGGAGGSRAEVGPGDAGSGRTHGGDADEGPRPRLDAALLRRFPPAFRAGGTVTAGNSCADADGAVVVVVTSRARARELGLERRLGLGFGDGPDAGPGGALAFVDAEVCGTDPNLLGIGGGEAGRALLGRRGVAPGSLAHVEFAEAFAAQVLASLDRVGVAEDTANLQGGALAFGHPFGASGALLVLRLLQRSRADAADGALSLAAVSIAGGLGLAALFRWDARRPGRSARRSPEG